MLYVGVSKSSQTTSTDRQPMALRECALCLRAGNVATQCAKWHRCVNIGSCTTRVFVTTCAVTFAISAWTWNWSSEQTSNSASNSANLERRLLKCYDVRMEMRPCVVRRVSSGTRASREAQHHSKTTRGQGELWAILGSRIIFVHFIYCSLVICSKKMCSFFSCCLWCVRYLWSCE